MPPLQPRWKLLDEREALRAAFSAISNASGGGFQRFTPHRDFGGTWIYAGDGTEADSLLSHLDPSGIIATSSVFFSGMQKWFINAFGTHGLNVPDMTWHEFCIANGLVDPDGSYGFRRAIGPDESGVMQYERGMAPRAYGSGLKLRHWTLSSFLFHDGFPHPPYADLGYKSWMESSGLYVFHRAGYWMIASMYDANEGAEEPPDYQTPFYIRRYSNSEFPPDGTWDDTMYPQPQGGSYCGFEEKEFDLTDGFWGSNLSVRDAGTANGHYRSGDVPEMGLSRARPMWVMDFLGFKIYWRNGLWYCRSGWVERESSWYDSDGNLWEQGVYYYNNISYHYVESDALYPPSRGWVTSGGEPSALRLHPFLLGLPSPPGPTDLMDDSLIEDLETVIAAW